MTSENDTEQKGAKKITQVVSAKRAGWIALNILVPASEVSQVFRYTGKNFTRLWHRIRDITARSEEGGYCPSDWSQAVKDSGLPPERLRKNFIVSKWIWWILMWLTGLPTLGCLLILFAAGHDVNLLGWLRIGSVLLVLALISATGFIQTLKVMFRLWQLQEQRVSASEKGAFKNFLSEVRWARAVLSAGFYA